MSSDNKRTESHLGKLTPDLAKKPITALNVNGTVIIPESTLLKADGLSHIMPSLQRPLNYTQVPKIAVPLNTTKYNPSLDDNLTLISSFNKFPYRRRPSSPGSPQPQNIQRSKSKSGSPHRGSNRASAGLPRRWKRPGRKCSTVQSPPCLRPSPW